MCLVTTKIKSFVMFVPSFQTANVYYKAHDFVYIFNNIHSKQKSMQTITPHTCTTNNTLPTHMTMVDTSATSCVWAQHAQHAQHASQQKQASTPSFTPSRLLCTEPTKTPAQHPIPCINSTADPCTPCRCASTTAPVRSDPPS